jgi:hypothetical protein
VTQDSRTWRLDSAYALRSVSTGSRSSPSK